jgi:CHAT domain-containing protein/tetratricopeptide (TPR) repeat protein
VKEEDISEELAVRYLLGDLSEDESQRIEEKYFADSDLYDQLRAAERDLIDRYARGELSGADRQRFEDRFLNTPGRRDRVEFGVALNRYVSKLAASPTEQEPGKGSLAQRAQAKAYATTYLRIAALILITAGLGFGIWRAVFYQSNVARARAALQTAFRQQRPLESRISGFEYAPLPNTRGGGPVVTDQKDEDLAKGLLLVAVSERPDAETRHALGQLYLAEGNFDKAIAEIEEALKTQPANAGLHSDIGAAFLEKGAAISLNESSGEGLRSLGEALEHLNRALELDSTLFEALFNRALCYERLRLIQLAKTDWENYIGKDPNSRWADEAGQHLAAIKERGKSSRNDDQLLQEFVTAYRAGQDQEAWSAFISAQRSARNGVVEKLLDEYIELSAEGSDAEATEKLSQLSYAGELAVKTADDRFGADLSRFYRSAGPESRAALSSARKLVQSGREQLSQTKLDEASRLFDEAGQIFERAGDNCEAALARFLTAHVYLRRPDLKSALEMLEGLERECSERGYKSLLAQTLEAIADAEFSRNKYSRAIDSTVQALRLAESAQDSGSQMRALLQLCLEYNAVANYDVALGYLQRSLTLAAIRTPEPGQLRAIYDSAADCFQGIRSFAAAIDYQREVLRLVSTLGSDLVQSRCHANLAGLYGKARNYAEGIKQAMLSYQIGEKLSGQPSGQDMMAFASLRLGDLYRGAGDPTRALASYDKNIEIYDSLNFPAETFAAHKGKVLCYLDQNDDASAQKEIDLTLGLLDQFRSKIVDDTSKTSFFDSEQDIYDVAINFEYLRVNDPRKAFEYAEAGRARSLLDMINRDGGPVDRDYESNLRSSARPLGLSEIQERLPEGTQIVQYAALDDHTVMWVISRTGLSTARAAVPLDDLRKRVEHYRQEIMRQPGHGSLQDAFALYDVLIKPVEPFLDPKKYICIVPDKVLNYVPFNALVSPASGKYLIDDYLIGFSPSSTVFIKCCEISRAKEFARDERLLSVSNPRFDRSAFPSLRDLPAADREASEISALYGGSRYLSGAAALKTSIKAELPKSDVAQFATHYVPDEMTPMRSKLLLAKGQGSSEEGDGCLEAGEIYGMNLPRTRLVVLSACQTGIERSYRGEGAIGIARPFIAARVPLVVASLWPIDSDSAAELMIEFQRQRKVNGISSAEALRAAERRMLGDPDRRYRSPYYWGSFIITGGFARF